jgi:hypothetical protein
MEPIVPELRDQVVPWSTGARPLGKSRLDHEGTPTRSSGKTTGKESAADGSPDEGSPEYWLFGSDKRLGEFIDSTHIPLL